MDARPEEIGARIHLARVYAGFSQKDAAIRLGITTGTLMRWESGETPIRDFVLDGACKEMGNIFHCSADWLKKGVGKPPNPPTPQENNIRPFRPL